MKKLRILAVYLVLSIKSVPAFAQGSAVVMPLSKAVYSAEEVISFQVHNLQDDELTLAIEPKCELDGTSLVAAACNSTFKVTYDPNPKNGKIKLNKHSSVQGTVALVNPPKHYALFKPLISPVLAQKEKPQGISFEFNYQPGYLFLIDKANQEIKKVSLSLRETKDARIARFVVDLGSLSMPAVASFSAKILDKKSKNLLKFLRLASDKILDPQRGKVELEGAFADSAASKQDICYELIVQWLAQKSMQRLSGCSES